MAIIIVGSGANERRIWTEYWRKGRPGFGDTTRFDWQATEADYDPEYDPTGEGSTEEDAIADLLTKLGERE